jgi:hypothetical protein
MFPVLKKNGACAQKKDARTRQKSSYSLFLPHKKTRPGETPGLASFVPGYESLVRRVGKLQDKGIGYLQEERPVFPSKIQTFPSGGIIGISQVHFGLGINCVRE